MSKQSWSNIEDGWAVGTRMWVADQEAAWVPGVVTSNVTLLLPLEASPC